jgi:putative hydrolase of HD superfamily
MSLRDETNLLYELGALRLIPRQWARFHLDNVQNLAEHHFRVAWIALVIAQYEKCDNTDKILKMALVHDVSESRTGDAEYMARQYVERFEDKAIEDIFDKSKLGQEMVAVWREYEERESLEARIVKDADNLDVDLDLREAGSRGHGLEKHWSKQRQFVGSVKMYTPTGKRLHKAIWSTSPHDWHIKSPHNRLQSGDWREYTARKKP